MKIEMIGHASIFIETQDAKFMMDPVLWDPHQEGILDVCPQRDVIIDQIPDFDILIISHKHLDHFDIRSLAHLPRTVEVIIPQDKLIEDSLRKLGYTKIYATDEFQELKIGASTNLMTTRSENRVPEFGVLLQDDSGVFWNCVDTELSLNTIGLILRKYAQIDFLLATWQPMMECNYQYNKSLAFPYEHYGQLLYNISLIRPKAISPGANAFKYINDSAFLNQIVFPVTREKFCQDVQGICPDLEGQIFPLEPGDSIEFDQSNYHHQTGGCSFVKRIRDDRNELDFYPVTIAGKPVDSNSQNYDVKLMGEAIEEAIANDLITFIQAARHSLFHEHFHWNIVYQLDIVFPDGIQQWFIDFSQEPLTAQKGRNPLANLFACITASALYGLLKQQNGWDYVDLGGYYRNFNKVYRVTPYGLFQPHTYQIPITDPLIHLYANEEIENMMRDVEIEMWKVDGQTATAAVHEQTLITFCEH